mmetsp:Transcript_17251/g.40530  ORF Transcript_17251/g.40530 Transcript_17251/m.40530 type:complete len:99 (+) Transcript_17251:298-594(+)
MAPSMKKLDAKDSFFSERPRRAPRRTKTKHRSKESSSTCQKGPASAVQPGLRVKKFASSGKFLPDHNEIFLVHLLARIEQWSLVIVQGNRAVSSPPEG